MFVVAVQVPIQPREEVATRHHKAESRDHRAALERARHVFVSHVANLVRQDGSQLVRVQEVEESGHHRDDARAGARRERIRLA